MSSTVRSWCAPHLLLATLAVVPGPVAAQQACAETAAFGRLDFWLGEWDVMADGQQVGSNVISKILAGCAVREEWTGRGGSEGESLFYYVPGTGEWKQVWVTNTATRTGGVKEKTLTEVLDGGGVRFEGLVTDAEGSAWHDRTTLTPVDDGRVRQHIEISQDGVEWQTIFDAVYVPRGLP